MNAQERSDYYEKLIYKVVFGTMGTVFGLFGLYVLMVGPQVLTGAA